MKIAFYGDSLTEGFPGCSYFRLLREQFPEHSLLNFGRFNDTAISLHRRIITRRLLEPVDVSFLWVGINDLIVPESRLFSHARRWWARDDAEFRVHYRALLDLLSRNTDHLVAASPALLSEDVDGARNRAVAARAAIIKELAGNYANVEFVDLHGVFMRALGESGSGYWPGHPFQGLVDTVRLRGNAAVDAMSAQRGLRLTLDGVHLNSAGAALVAGVFKARIDALARSLSQDEADESGETEA